MSKKVGRPPRTHCKYCGGRIPKRQQGKTGPHRTFCSIQCRQVADRRYHIERVYGITQEEYKILLEAQDNACAICGSSDPKSNRGSSGTVNGSFHIDHDHISGKIRGLLCSMCNRMLGQANDNPDVLRAGADYLDRAGSSLSAQSNLESVR